MPALRAAGASTLTVLLVEAVETPKASGNRTSSDIYEAELKVARQLIAQYRLESSAS